MCYLCKIIYLYILIIIYKRIVDSPCTQANIQQNLLIIYTPELIGRLKMFAQWIQNANASWSSWYPISLVYKSQRHRHVRTYINYFAIIYTASYHNKTILCYMLKRTSWQTVQFVTACRKFDQILQFDQFSGNMIHLVAVKNQSFQG